MTDKPNPGSDAAIEQGCTCPVLDNAHGRGYMGQVGVFVYSGDCPVHPMGETVHVDTGLVDFGALILLDANNKVIGIYENDYDDAESKLTIGVVGN